MCRVTATSLHNVELALPLQASGDALTVLRVHEDAMHACKTCHNTLQV